jgi:hypothetical protein
MASVGSTSTVIMATRTDFQVHTHALTVGYSSACSHAFANLNQSLIFPNTKATRYSVNKSSQPSPPEASTLVLHKPPSLHQQNCTFLFTSRISCMAGLDKHFDGVIKAFFPDFSLLICIWHHIDRLVGSFLRFLTIKGVHKTTRRLGGNCSFILHGFSRSFGGRLVQAFSVDMLLLA